jgi:NAD(P)-dependent dehydrogenase (short-subunit alcohol dehydrogenase family)
VVNNAGFAQAGAVEDVTDAQARYQLEVNLLAPVRIARLVVPAMRRRGGGRIVNISSFYGLIAAPAMGWYTASKFALEGISDALRVEVAPAGVRVILVEPGGYRTGIWDRGVAGLPPRDTSPYGHLYGLVDVMLEHARGLPEPDPVARAVRRALTSPRPRRRYVVGADARAALALDTVLPSAAMDYLKGIRTGLRPPRTRAGHLGARILGRFI